jgi:hypothetical protein
MDSDYIKTLVEKYWHCETTLEEEKILREYFSGKDIPEELISCSGLFRYYDSLTGLESINNFNPVFLREFNSSHSGNYHILRNKFSWIYKAAAIIILVLTSIIIHEKFITVKNKTVKVYKDSFDNPEVALMEAKQTILLVSNKLRKGKIAASQISAFGRTEYLIRTPKK